MTLDLSPGVSQFQLACIVLIGVASLVALWLSGVPLEMNIAATPVVLLSVSDWLKRSLRRSPDSIIRLQFESGSWWLTLADGRMRKFIQAGEQVVLPWIVSLGFSDGRDRFESAIFFDAVTATEHRKLRAFVLLHSSQSTVQSSGQSSGPWLSVSRWYQNGVRRVRRH